MSDYLKRTRTHRVHDNLDHTDYLDNIDNLTRSRARQGSKFLVFAHHLAMLDAIEQELVASRTDYIRIDGSVSSVQRQEYVRKFQTVDTCKVAVLGSCYLNNVLFRVEIVEFSLFCRLILFPSLV